VSEEAAFATVGAAYDAGVRFFDTAPLYGFGAAEIRLGQALAGLPRNDIAIATKVGRLLVGPSDQRRHGAPPDPGNDIYRTVRDERPIFDFSHDAALRSLEESLVRLTLDRVEIAHVHDPEGRVDEAISGALRALLELRDQGVVGAVGVGTDVTATAVRFARETDIDCVLVAGRLTVLDREATHDLVPLCTARGISMIAAGAFNSGILADPSGRATFDYRPANHERRERTKRLESVCASFGVPLAAAAIQFPLRFGPVRSVVFGARRPEEVEQDLALADLEMPAGLWEALDAV
jgi:D-threo-aldose 1-dehydrogenase